MELRTLAFYKFVVIDKPEQYTRSLLRWCKQQGLRGRILVGKEGINGGVSGTSEQTAAFKTYLQSDPRFQDIAFKEDMCTFHPFARMVVKVKDEIVRFGIPVNLEKTAPHLSSEEFLKSYADDVVILDTRNEYEWNVGKFKNALTLPITTFREFPEAVKKLAHLKDKKIVMYCTGGIRCEKASAYMIEQGFSNVAQLNGGILTFCKEKPNTVWEGSCFVFDKRLVTNVEGNTPITSCAYCGAACDLYRNCRNNDCDDYLVICPACDQTYQGCCSAPCFETYKKTWHTSA